MTPRTGFGRIEARATFTEVARGEHARLYEDGTGAIFIQNLDNPEEVDQYVVYEEANLALLLAEREQYTWG